MDWLRWHTAYDQSPILQARLTAVRAQIAEAIHACPDANIRLISLCAGDGRDVIGTVVNHARRDQISAYLIEINPALVAQGESAIAQLDLSAQVRFVQADATVSETYQSIAPADVLVVCGVFGNVRESDTVQMIESLRCLCRPGGRVIWTRTVALPDDRRVAELVRQRFGAAGFQEVALANPAGHVVATHVYNGDAYPLMPGVKLFEFTGCYHIGSPTF